MARSNRVPKRVGRQAWVVSALATWFLCGPFQIVGAQTVTIDPLNKNVGTLDNGLQFGAPRLIKGSNNKNISIPAGEGIASNRAFSPNTPGQGRANGIAGANVFGLDFFTANLARVSITNSGQVGIGTSGPTHALELQSDGDVELALKSHDAGGRLWTIQSSGTGTGNDPALDGTFQIVDRTLGLSRLKIDGLGMVSVSVLQITGGADIAEPFRMATTGIAKGSVVVIDEKHAGQLRLSDHPYDHRVAGIVSGANGIIPGISLSQRSANFSGENVALSGRVYALADATGAPIEPGDFLTTSYTPGYCMKVTDHSKGRGAIIGKAMSSLALGRRGQVLVLVSLQ